MSRPPRFFIAPEQVRDGRITVAGEDARHITAVLRMRPGDELVLCDGQGADYRARITSAGKNEVATEVLEATRRGRAGPRIVLGQGIPKADKMDFVVQKATELGVTSIVPLVTERTIVRIRDEEKRITRWRKIAREAAMQSDRTDIPNIEPILRLNDFLGALNSEPGTLLLFPWEEGTVPIREVLRAHAGVRDIAVLIGPEGGFSSSEAELAKRKGFHAVSLGPNILRTETAAIAVLGMIGYEYS